MTSSLTPVEVALYIDTYGNRSVRPVVPYLWTHQTDITDDDYVVTELEVEGLEEVLLDELQHIEIDPAIYVRTTPQGTIALMTHEFGDGIDTPVWVSKLLLVISPEDVDTLTSALWLAVARLADGS